jgi:hypothetical protein
MLTVIEQGVTRNLGISEKAFAERKAERTALHTPELDDYTTPTRHRVCRMARSVGAQPTAFLSYVVDRSLRELDEAGGLDDSGASESKVSATPLLLNVTPEQIARVARHQQSNGTFVPAADSSAEEVSTGDFISGINDIMADFSRWLRAADGGNPEIGELRSMLEQNRDRIDAMLAKLADATGYWGHGEDL